MGVRDKETEENILQTNDGTTIEILEETQSSSDNLVTSLTSQAFERWSLSSEASASLVNILKKLEKGETIILFQAQAKIVKTLKNSKVPAILKDKVKNKTNKNSLEAVTVH